MAANFRREIGDMPSFLGLTFTMDCSMEKHMGALTAQESCLHLVKIW